jgi:hypothetical protein
MLHGFLSADHWAIAVLVRRSDPAAGLFYTDQIA